MPAATPPRPRTATARRSPRAARVAPPPTPRPRVPARRAVLAGWVAWAAALGAIVALLVDAHGPLGIDGFADLHREELTLGVSAAVGAAGSGLLLRFTPGTLSLRWARLLTPYRLAALSVAALGGGLWGGLGEARTETGAGIPAQITTAHATYQAAVVAATAIVAAAVVLALVAGGLAGVRRWKKLTAPTPTHRGMRLAAAFAAAATLAGLPAGAVIDRLGTWNTSGPLPALPVEQPLLAAAQHALDTDAVTTTSRITFAGQPAKLSGRMTTAPRDGSTAAVRQAQNYTSAAGLPVPADQLRDGQAATPVVSGAQALLNTLAPVGQLMMVDAGHLWGALGYATGPLQSQTPAQAGAPAAARCVTGALDGRQMAALRMHAYVDQQDGHGPRLAGLFERLTDPSASGTVAGAWAFEHGWESTVNPGWQTPTFTACVDADGRPVQLSVTSAKDGHSAVSTLTYDRWGQRSLDADPVPAALR